MLTATLLYLLFMFLAMSLFRLSSRHSRAEEQRDALLIPTIVRRRQRELLESNLSEITRRNFPRTVPVVDVETARWWESEIRDEHCGG